MKERPLILISCHQNQYADVEYGNGTLQTSGCGITCAAMVISAYTGQQVTPDMLASQIEWDGNDTTLNRALNAYGIKNANNNFLVASPNSKYEYIDDGLTEIGKNAIYYDEVKQKISEGYVAIFQMNDGVFTDGSHFVLVTGLTEDGNFIIQDPNGNNYVPTGSTDSQILQNGFENGFTDDDIRGSWSGCYLIEPYEDYVVRNAN